MSFPHVTLSAPAQEAPVEQRVQAYEQLSPAPTIPGYVFTSDPNRPRELELSSGERVYWAEDLLPVVPARSRTANAARKSARMRQRGATLALVGSIIAGVGGAL